MLPLPDDVVCVVADEEAPVPVVEALDVDGVKDDAGLVETETEAVLERVIVEISAGEVEDEREAGTVREDVREATAEEKEPDIPSRLGRGNRVVRGEVSESELARSGRMSTRTRTTE